MIRNIQIEGAPDSHPEKPVYDAHQLAAGKVDLSTLAITGHSVRVFDLMDADQRDEYEKLYVTLSDLSRQGKILISSNIREVLRRSDGSTGWFKCLEWTTFDTSSILGA